MESREGGTPPSGPTSPGTMAGEVEAQLRILTEAAFEGLAVHEQGKIIIANDAAAEMFGRTRDELVGMNALDLAAPESVELVRRKIQTGSEAPYEAAGLRKDGSRFWCELRGRAYPYQGRTVRITAMRDITERKLAEEALLQQTARYEAVLRAQSDVGEGHVISRGGRLRYANDAFCRISGYNVTELLAMPTLLELVWPDERSAAAARFADRTGEPLVEHFTTAIRHKSGRRVELELSVKATGDGPERELLAIVRDVTARRQAEDALARSEARFRALIERSPDAIAVHRRGLLEYVNPAMVAVLRAERAEQLTGRPLADVVHPEDREQMAGDLDRLRNGRESAVTGEYRFTTGDGRVMSVELTSILVEIDDVSSILSLGRDVTLRRQLEASLLKADRLASLGTLAAGVAHEINNPLTYVLLHLAHAGRELPRISADLHSAVAGSAAASGAGHRIEAVARRLEEARAGVERIELIVRDLKTFSRAGEDDRRPVDVRAVLDSAINMAGNEIRHRAQLVRDYGRVPCVQASEARLGQVFLNLLVNAAQSLREGGSSRNTISVRTCAQASRVIVEIEDTGCGMPPEILARIFDPFFTTKPVGIGTGLGLSICHGIVTGLGGEIYARSTPSVGSAFVVALPCAAEHAETPAPPSSPVVTLNARRTRVLVVDDDASVTRAVREALADAHDVETAASGRDALDRLERRPSIDVILCDLMMPGMTGMDFFEELRRKGSALADRVVFMTGGAFTPPARRFLDRVASPRIEKPFAREALLELVRRFAQPR